jgi:hypothetical protein
MIRRRAKLGALAAVTTAAAALTVSAAPASAQFEAQYQNQETEGCLSYHEIRSRPYAGHCKFNGDSVFKVHKWRDGTVQLKTRYELLGYPNRCLDDSRHGLRLFAPCWPGKSRYSRYQSWYRHYLGYGRHFTFRNQATGRCLDDSPRGLRTFPCNGTSWQTWLEGDWPF